MTARQRENMDRNSEAERRLAVVLAADVVGYSRLMGEDEEGTLRQLAEHRAVLEDAVRRHRGRIVATAGDGFLAELPSASEAVEAAAEVQRDIARRNRLLPEEQQMQFRIGINLGDVFEQGDDLLGDAVNVAARLEGLADPGGICIGRPVRDSVRGKLPFDFDFLGVQRVKNIRRPVKAYSVVPREGAGWSVPRHRRPASRLRVVGLAAAVVVLVALAFGLGAYMQQRDDERPAAPVRPPSTATAPKPEPPPHSSSRTAGERSPPPAETPSAPPASGIGSSTPPADATGLDQKKFGP